ncbi:MAG TPA: ABC transporter permease [Terriglobales bacterium]|nr:ABC transporter permease [Terriglobales bacterium]
MFLRLLYQSFRRQQRRKLLAGIAVILGVAVATAMIAVGVDVGDKINRELRSYGANIVVYPEDAALDVRIGDQQIKPVSSGSYLKESDLSKIKGIFWGHNILAFAPFFETQARVENRSVRVLGTYFDRKVRFGTDDFTAGVEKLYPWWRIEGSWPKDGGSEILLGTSLASQIRKDVGDTLELSNVRARVVGIVTTGGTEDTAVVAPLALAQQLANAPNAVDKIYVSALTKPEDAFARRDPNRMNAADHDRWYCSPYANSIAYQLSETFPGARAEQIRQAAQNEGMVLSHISGLMLLIAIASLIAAALAVSAAMATTILERRREVGLMKSLGATATTIALLFVTEASLLALAAGLIGFAFGTAIAQRIGQSIFHSGVEITSVLLPIVIFLALFVTIGGSAAAIRRALKLDPVVVLRGDA